MTADRMENSYGPKAIPEDKWIGHRIFFAESFSRIIG
jgi:hypothetical protein